MNATFADIHAAADFIGPGAVEVPLYQTEIIDICRRSGPFGQRIKQVPATGHPSRFFEETAMPDPGAAGLVDPRNIVAPVVSPTRVERSVPLKAMVSQINYNLFDIELGQSAAAVRLSAGEGPGRHRERRHGEPRCGAVERQRHLPELADHHAVHGRGRADRRRRQHGDDRHHGMHRGWLEVDSGADGGQQLATSVRPTAIYANPVLLDLIDREMKSEFNVVLNTDQITGGFRVKMLSTQAGDLPLIPEWSLSYTGTPGSGSAVLPGLHRDRGPDRVPLARAIRLRASSSSACRDRFDQQIVVREVAAARS